jgi:hypothetical protein
MNHDLLRRSSQLKTRIHSHCRSVNVIALAIIKQTIYQRLLLLLLLLRIDQQLHIAALPAFCSTSNLSSLCTQPVMHVHR